MSTLMASPPVYGLNEGYRRSQLGDPVSSVGQQPKYRGQTHTPGDDVKAPQILASASRNNRGTNVTIPYARVVPANELANKGRLSFGDVAFIARFSHDANSQARLNQEQKRQITMSVSTSHATISHLAGVDHINKLLSSGSYKEGYNVLVDNVNPLDDWRSLEVLSTWTLDGVVMSNDSPAYFLSTSEGVRNDQIFNVAIQGRATVNNGYQDRRGGGMAIDPSKGFSDLITGPLYHQYPLQMFDRNIKPLDELYIGLVCKMQPVTSSKINTFKADAKFIHTFQYVLFSSGNVPVCLVPSNEATDTSEWKRSNLKRSRDDDDGFCGIRDEDLKGMVGAWRLGKVIDVASQRKQGYYGGPIDTTCAVTLNVNVGFLDWRQLRRNFTSNIFGCALTNESGIGNWGTYSYKIIDGIKRGLFGDDDKSILQWPTRYIKDLTPSLNDDRIPYDPTLKSTDDVVSMINGYKDKVAKSENAKSSDSSPGESALYDSNSSENKESQKERTNAAKAAMNTALGTEIPSAFVQPMTATEQRPGTSNAVAMQASTTNTTPDEDAFNKSEVFVAKNKEPVIAKPDEHAGKSKTFGTGGDDVMASIFGSAVPQSADVSMQDPTTSGEEARPASQKSKPKSFPRRRDR